MTCIVNPKPKIRASAAVCLLQEFQEVMAQYWVVKELKSSNHNGIIGVYILHMWQLVVFPQFSNLSSLTTTQTSGDTLGCLM